MKAIYVLILSLTIITQTEAQLFTPVQGDPIVSDYTDSRSVNIVDVNNDGADDVFISNGLEGGQDDLLYINNGDATFTKDSSAITSDGKSSVGASFADYDNDGDLDAYVTNWYGQLNGLFTNDGNGIFNQMGNTTLPQEASYSETATWGDYDDDGRLDLFVTNSGVQSNAGTRKNALYRQADLGTFVPVDTGVIVTETDYSRNADWLDLDKDGDLDLLVSNESNQPNDWYLNEGDGYFLKQTGQPLVTTNSSTMSFSAGDIDNDGDLDLFFANALYFQEQDNLLFRNENGVFEADENSILSSDGGCSYGSAFGDYNNDGHLDLVVSNGFCNGTDNLKNRLYENQGDGTFIKVENAFSDLPMICSYGLAWGDLNNDGFLDLVIANCKNSPSFPTFPNEVLLNNGNDNNWVKINLIGTISNRSAIGAEINLTASIDGQEVTQLRTISSQSGYAGQNSLTVHFGLGDASTIALIEVHWPSGITTTLQNEPANQTLTIEETTSGASTPFLKDNQIQIIPNPNHGEFKLRLDITSEFSDQDIHLKLMDTLGRLVHYQRMNGHGTIEKEVQVSQLPSGKYLLLIEQGKQQIGKKWFVKQ